MNTKVKNSKSIYIVHATGTAYGPHTLEKIKVMAADGRVRPDTLLQIGDLKGEVPAKRVNGLVFSEEPPEQDDHEPDFTKHVETAKEKAQEGFVFLDTGFNRMISPTLIRWGYVAGLVLVGVFGLLGILYTAWENGLKDAAMYVIFWVFGLFGIRIGAEFMILFFRINDRLKEIAEK